MPHSLCGFCFGFSPYALRLTIYGTKYTLCAKRHALCDLLLGGPTFLWMTPQNKMGRVPIYPVRKPRCLQRG